MTRKKARLLYYALAAVGFVLMAIGCVGFGRVWLYVGIAFMVACTWVSMQCNRCPHCGLRLGTWRTLNTCPSCGQSLSE